EIGRSNLQSTDGEDPDWMNWKNVAKEVPQNVTGTKEEFDIDMEDFSDLKRQVLDMSSQEFTHLAYMYLVETVRSALRENSSRLYSEKRLFGALRGPKLRALLKRQQIRSSKDRVLLLNLVERNLKAHGIKIPRPKTPEYAAFRNKMEWR